MNSVAEITIEDYRTVPELRDLADRIMAAGSLDKNDVTYIERTKGRWLCHLLVRGGDGKIKVRGGEAATRTVWVDL
jgi:hypothetical protein